MKREEEPRRRDVRVVRGPDADAGSFYVQSVLLSILFSTFFVVFFMAGMAAYTAVAVLVSRLGGSTDVLFGPVGWIMTPIVIISGLGAILATRQAVRWFERRAKAVQT